MKNKREVFVKINNDKNLALRIKSFLEKAQEKISDIYWIDDVEFEGIQRDLYFRSGSDTNDGWIIVKCAKENVDYLEEISTEELAEVLGITKDEPKTIDGSVFIDTPEVQSLGLNDAVEYSHTCTQQPSHEVTLKITAMQFASATVDDCGNQLTATELVKASEEIYKFLNS